ncbi:DUF108 domain-containing protein [Acuticoccus sp. MNP-M23]|uniref:aspartate dehydrogenase domain-containing protein n=1 Tax=Acuticoccus sp. MNP-M23 TaxID=3072793 RepID=UPI002815FEBB|nr:aspartate dehydrogenase domain-containing protein [Acuticoccus sp. MNP-M23]WMS44632.1 DUF108 domain-containing protein [Acuticoccus sp. MNP-M23]
MLSVNVVGRGRIGSAVAGWISASGAYRLQDIITRDSDGWRPAALTIEAAGPDALRNYGAQLLAEGEVWSVGAVALADSALGDALQECAAEHGHRLRLFTGWAAGVTLVPRNMPGTLHVRQEAPGLASAPGTLFSGPLAEAAARFPDYLNTACAAALAGPGIGSTTIELVCSKAGGPHRITAEFCSAVSTVRTVTDFTPDPPLHPVAAAIIAALEHCLRPLAYG